MRGRCGRWVCEEGWEGLEGGGDDLRGFGWGV